MFGYPLITIIAAAFFAWIIYAYFKKHFAKNSELEKSLEDETIYVEGMGQVNVEELDAETLNADPDVPSERMDKLL